MTDYDQFAEDYDKKARSSPQTTQYDRPAMLALLGEIAGARVLDAGCGSGLYAEDLLQLGAEVVAIDSSDRLLDIARQRVGDRVQWRRHDLSEPLEWLPDGSVDHVLMALVLHYLPDPVPTLREFHRVLRDTGTVVVSTSHPSNDWQHLGGSYFTDEMYQETWSTGWVMTHRRRPLQTIVNEFTQAGFLIDQLIEPRPTTEMRTASPATFERLNREPGFIAFRLTKR
ncbi:class I SAM-dependent methyltransferase [Ornithinimicrobium sp. Y1694]|uniref:class I SAM-dependent methyltransferase n=1 Tax=Ornithinimicrobium sp. Y1694 TaxID=3418590 RepID=UPI003CEC43F8